MILVDCPAFTDQDFTQRCALPAEVVNEYVMQSTDGPVRAMLIKCVNGHCFNGPVDMLVFGRGEHG